jgi:hypothetical protein
MRKYIDLLNESLTYNIRDKTFYFDEVKTEPSTVKTIAVKEKSTDIPDDLIRHYGTLTYSDGELSLLQGGDDEKPKILPTPLEGSLKSIVDSFDKWYEKK